MRKHVVMGLAFLISSFAFAQKKEIKEAEKALKNNDFANAKSSLSFCRSIEFCYG